MSNPKKAVEELKQALGEDLSPQERAYLEKLENDLKGSIDYDDPDQVEAEIRRRERERIQKNFQPRNPLYPAGAAESTSNMKPSKSGRNDTESKLSYQNDPRYREYYERLRQARAAGQTTPAADDSVDAISMDVLEKQGYPAEPPRRQTTGANIAPGARPVSTNATTGMQSRQPGGPSSVRPKYTNIAPGAIMRLDDGSIAVYKDAVSGKDYALFYFLEPDGSIAPRGIFLQQYDAIRIGHLPEPLFAEMRDSGRWERDAIIFHLERYDYAIYVHKVAAHQEGRQPTRVSRSEQVGEFNETQHDDDVQPAHQNHPPEPEFEPAPKLERGRKFKINFGGRAWEAMYWGKDEMGQVVAHNTNGDWQLMHLDLDRFMDSMEYGELITGDRLKEIEKSLLRTHR